MAGSAGYTITISATDHATAAIKAVNKQLEAARAPVEALHKQVSKFAELSGIKKMSEHIHEFGNHAREAGRHLADIARPLGFITGAASIAGIVELTTKWAEWGRELTHAAARINIAAPALHQWEGAARLAGASAGTMTAGMETLATTLHEMTWGRNAQAISYFTMLGFSMNDAKKYAGNVGAFLPILAERLSKIKDPITRMAYAQMFLGGASQQLFPLLSEGAEAIERYRKESEKLYPSSKQNIAVAEQFAAAQSRISLSFSNLYETAIVKLAPGMTSLIDKMTAWFSQPGTAEGLAKAIGDIAAAIKDIWGIIQAGVDKVGGWGNALKWLFGLWAGSKVLGTVAPLATPLALGGGFGLGRLLSGGGLGTLGGGLAAMLASPFMGPLAGQPGPVKGFWEWLTATRTPGQHAIREQYGPGTLSVSPQSWWTDPLGMLRRRRRQGDFGGTEQDLPEIGLAPTGMGAILKSADDIRKIVAGIGRSGVLGPQPQGTQSDPFYVKPADASYVGFAGSANPMQQMGGAIGATLRAAFGNPATLPGNISEQVREAAKRAGLNPDWMTALARAEGGNNPDGSPKTSPRGAFGTMQLMPGTARGLGVDPNDQKQNVMGGMLYFQQLLKRFNGSYGVATAAYNAGPDERGIRHFAETGDPSQLPAETQYYLRKIQSMMGERNDAPTAAPSGQASLHVSFANAPPGTRARGAASGNIWSAPPRVEMPLSPSFGALP